MKRLFKSFRYGQKGFTLVELLVVIAILGILAAVAIPNVTKFMGSGKSESAKTEYANVQLAIAAAMADTQTSTIAGGTFSPTQDLTVAGTTTAGNFIMGGIAKLHGTYTVGTDGGILTQSYP